MSSSRKPSRKETKRAALAALKAARDGTAPGTSTLDGVRLADEEDVYERMDEEQYREYVSKKGDREDFVVDDDGLGYHDNGDYDVSLYQEEDEHNDPNAPKRPKTANALTKEALKKARKNKQAANTGGEGEGGGKKNKSMWDFVNKGAAAPPAGGGERKSKSSGRGSTGRNENVADDFDDLLNELDDAPAPASRGRSSHGSGGRRSSAGSSRQRSVSRGRPSAGGRRSSHDGHHGGSRKRRASHEPASYRTPSNRRSGGGGRDHSRIGGRGRRELSPEPRIDFNRNDQHDDGDDDSFGGDDRNVDFGNDGGDMEDEVLGNNEAARETAAADAGDVEQDAAMENAEDNKVSQDEEKEMQESKNASASAANFNEADEKADDNDQGINNTDKAVSSAVSAARPRARTAGRLAGRLFAAREAKEAEEKKALEVKKLKEHQEQEAEKKRKEAAAAAAAKKNAKGGVEITVDRTTTSFQPSAIAAAGSIHESGVGGGSMKLEKIIMMETSDSANASSKDMEVDGEEKKEAAPEPRPYLDLYWLDAAERNGVVSLYGKVKVPIDSKKDGEKFAYQSCCVTIPNNERNLFVLPRLLPSTNEECDEDEEQTQERYPIGDVYKELRSVLQPSCIPKVKGANWKAKPVTRSYAFEDPSIPRGECQYLKVVYDGKYPVPDRKVCMNGGETFEKILGATASNLENFLIKRRLMGPGWVRIYNPKPVSGGNVSWCKWECTTEGPKSLKRLDLVSENGQKVTVPPPPPVSTVSIKFKTVVNPKTHKLEIVCVSVICHSKVLLDSASDESTKHMTALTLVRPVNFDSNGTMAQFPRDMEKEIKAMPQLQKSPNERALLSRLFAQLGTWDPDVIVSHNGWGHDIDVLLNRCVELKVSMWSKIGRRRQMRLPSSSQFGNGNSWAIDKALEGRVMCDTWLSAKEFLGRETTYSLANLSKTQLGVEDRKEIEPEEVPAYCRTGQHLVSLANHTLRDAELLQRLMFKMQALPLTKQLTNIAGNLWKTTMKSNRADRTEYLLLHEFHQLKYLVPEKRSKEDGGATAGKSKSKYSGGLVLEPKKGLYDSFILLLDFNSLYPSLIQEYNLCFTTMEWSKANSQSDAESTPQGDVLPSLPDESLDRGVLPRVIKTLVDRRRNVKKFMKSEKDADKKKELDIRQMALKLTANSMYGCLGFSNSRFYAQPIAALVTAMGRETLQSTVDLAQTTIGLEVIYGDTDSIMINTRITDVNEYPKVLELGNKVKREVNKKYRTLELEIDGVFRSMLLLKKKKYAAVTISEGPGGKYIMGQETKGLDLVRRDWCIQSKDSGHYILDQILSGEEKEAVINKIHDHLEKVAKQMRAGELPLDKYVITKSLSKHPNDYPDGNTLPHVFVAKRMLKDQKAVNIGEHIPYVITALEKVDEQQAQANVKKAYAERARHPEEVARSDGALTPDAEWYLTTQILPPISRLCEHIEGTSQGILAEKLGLDASKFNAVSVNIDEEDIVDYTPKSCLSDEERFKDVEKFIISCSGCGEENEFPGVFRLVKDEESGMAFCQSGLRCPNPGCGRPDNWGESDAWGCVAKILNKMNLVKREKQRLYYDGLVRCDDPMCGLETRQLSVVEGCCLKAGCNGRMKAVYTEAALQTQLKYFDSLFDIGHAFKQLERTPQTAGSLTEKEVAKSLAAEDKEVFRLLHGVSSRSLNRSGYNWVDGQFFQTLFGTGS